MRTNSAGVDLIKQFESFQGTAYYCPAGKLTIGYGHRIRKGENLNTISKAEALNLLKSDLQVYESDVTSVITRPMSANEFAAMVSLCYNIGGANFAKSSVVRQFNAGRKQAAADAFLRWNKAHTSQGFVALAGLSRRRREERELFLSQAKFQIDRSSFIPDHPIDFSAYNDADLVQDHEVEPIPVPDLPRHIEPPKIEPCEVPEEIEQVEAPKAKIGRPQALGIFGLVSWLLSDVLGIPVEYVQYAWNWITPYFQYKPLKWALIGLGILALYGYSKNWHKTLPKKLKKLRKVLNE